MDIVDIDEDRTQLLEFCPFYDYSYSFVLTKEAQDGCIHGKESCITNDQRVSDSSILVRVNSMIRVSAWGQYP